MPNLFKRLALKSNAEYSNQSDGSIQDHDRVNGHCNTSVGPLDKAQNEETDRQLDEAYSYRDTNFC